jgi:hypothetical protein
MASTSWNESLIIQKNIKTDEQRRIIALYNA